MEGKLKKPPKIPTWILGLFSNPEVDFSIAGDFEEEYYEMADRKGVNKARLWYWLHVANSVPTFIRDTINRSTAMFGNYIKIAIRNLMKQKIYSAINIFGLSIGLACSILIYLFVRDEMKFERFHQDVDKIFEVYSVIDAGAYRINFPPQLPVADVLQRDFPEIISATRVVKIITPVRKDDRIFSEKVIASSQEFFDIFTFPMAQQLNDRPLEDINSVIITGRIAEKYFAEENPLGKTITISTENRMNEFIISGILEELPTNSGLKFDLIINIERLYGDKLNEWKENSAGAVIKVNDPEGYRQLEERISNNLNEKYSDAQSTYHLQPFADFHLKGGYSYLLESASSSRYSYILTGIALIVLLIACFNFMNLAIGRSSIRIKEIGMRKVFGARRKQLYKQFWFESYLISFIALIAGVVLTLFFLPAFSHFTQKIFSASDLFSPFSVVVILAITVFSGFIAGSYPAVVLSGFRPVDLFKNELKFSNRNLFTRSLIFLQFFITVILILSTVFMFLQYRYLVGKDLGFNTDNMIVISLEEIPENLRQSSGFYEDLSGRINQVSNVTGTGFSGSKLTSSVFGATFPKLRTTSNQVLISYTNVDENFFETLGIKLLSGRNFSPGEQNEAGRNVIVNSSFIEKLDLNNSIGTEFSEVFVNDQGSDNTFTSKSIIGVTEDFNYHSLHYEVYPLYLEYAPEKGYGYIYVRLNGENTAEAVSDIKDRFMQIVPDTPFIYTFFDEEIQSQYALEQRWSSIINYSSFFAVIIASSGLFGVSLMSVVRKTREISIRKVLGSSVTGIIKLISKDFIGLVILANIAAWPVSFFIARTLLQNYAFTITIDFWIFVLTGMAATIIAGSTICFHAVRAASMNPVNTLRSE